MRLAVRRFLLPAGLLLVTALWLYQSQPIGSPRSGSSWQGYALGGLAAALLVWLGALGVRKRRYFSADNVRGWVAAHMVLGLAVVVVVLLHSSANLGWNVHGLSFVLLLLVVGSGVCGAVFYLVMPPLLVDLRQGTSREEFLGELRAADERCLALGQRCNPEVELAVRSAITGTLLGEGLIAQLTGKDHSTAKLPAQDGGAESSAQANADQAALQRYLAAAVVESHNPQHVVHLQNLVLLIARRRELLRRIRTDIRLQGWLRAWLLVHGPLTAALLAAVFVHVFVVFFYW